MLAPNRERSRSLRDPARARNADRRHPGDVVRLVSGTAVVLLSASMAAGGHVARLEVDLFRLVNDLPAALTPPLQVVMQGGTFGAVWVAAGLGLAARRRRLARDLAVGGTAAWLAAKVVKVLVGRGRPGGVLSGVALHGTTTAGLGFPSGHAAVAAALATVAGPYLSRRGRRWTWGGVALISWRASTSGPTCPWTSSAAWAWDGRWGPRSTCCGGHLEAGRRPTPCARPWQEPASMWSAWRRRTSTPGARRRSSPRAATAATSS